MAKKETTKKSKSVPAKADRRGHATFEFVKAATAVPDGIMTAVYAAVKTVKRGTVAEITQVAVGKFGLKKVTSQDPLNQTHVMLNRLKHLKAVRRVTPSSAPPLAG